ncbi:potassium transporter TrkG, partial [Loktanella sp. DJP18]|uniref:potassium transporter TrkG n=1 Tax=Loktanella sp. DJP18 TaxID=3409788 RepID=UPI003BB60F71
MGLQSFRLPPPATLAVLYLGSILIGGILLWMPVSVEHQIPLFTALFISTSAVTVTGLATVDVGSTFTLFGEGVIMVLIQLGGLGLMTFAVLVLSALGIPVGMPQRLILREDLNQTALNNLTVLVRIVFLVSLMCEIVGLVALSFVWVPEFGWSKGLWHAAFHSVSAFNNAGFSLFPTSLMAYVGNPIINVVIPALFILGGLGF